MSGNWFIFQMGYRNGSAIVGEAVPADTVRCVPSKGATQGQGKELLVGSVVGGASGGCAWVGSLCFLVKNPDIKVV